MPRASSCSSAASHDPWISYLCCEKRRTDSAREPNPDADVPGLQRAWQAVIRALSSLISVKRSDASVTALRSPEAESIIMRSLDLDLQIARLALIRGNPDLYRQSLQDAELRIERFFDPQASEVQAAVATIGELGAADLPGELPDISGSLRLLVRLGTESAQP